MYNLNEYHDAKRAVANDVSVIVGLIVGLGLSGILWSVFAVAVLR